MKYGTYINMDSFGECCPANWEEIADYLNDIIRTRIENENSHGEMEQKEISESVWEQYCNGDLPDAPEPIEI